MRAVIVKLRRQGSKVPMPHIQSFSDVPSGMALEGLLCHGSIQQRTQGVCLHLRTYQSAPGCGILAVLYQPSLAKVEHSYLQFRGFEPLGDDAATAQVVMQEWLVFPNP